LAGLGEADSSKIFSDICGTLTPPEIGRELAARTGGVPLFIEELARSFAQDAMSETPQLDSHGVGRVKLDSDASLLTHLAADPRLEPVPTCGNGGRIYSHSVGH
jgi:hypothetical protein